MPDYLARLHPLLVHFPIGITLLAVLLSWHKQGAAVQKLVWMAASGSALLAAGTGWLLLSDGDYPDALIRNHQWSGTGIAVFVGLLTYLQFRRISRAATRGLALLLLILLALTTHFGTVLTHGADYWSGKDPAASEPASGNAARDIPPESAQAPDPDAVRRLEATGILVLPVAEGSAWLSVNAVNAPRFGDAEAALLRPLAGNILWLKLSGTAIGDSAMTHIAALKQLARLYLDDTRVGDAGLAALRDLPKLQLLNLSGLDISAAGLTPLKDLPALKKVYVYRCGIPEADFIDLGKTFGPAVLDTGGARLPTLPGDTARLQAPAY